jgi:leucyl-tRNA synthetase
MEYKEALKRGLYDFELARNWYRSVSNPENGGQGMHHDLVFGYIRSNTLLIAPFTPHFSEHIWHDILLQDTSVQCVPFPRASAPIDISVLRQLEYMRSAVDSIRSAEAMASKKKGKGRASSYDPSLPKRARIYVASRYPEWQNQCIEQLQLAWNQSTTTFDEAKMRSGLQSSGMLKDKRVMPFCQTFKVSTSARSRLIANSVRLLRRGR